MAANLKFENLCQMFEKISNAANKDKKSKYLEKLISSVRPSNNSLGASFFLLLRILLPKLDLARGSYGVKEHNLAKTYIRILCLPKDSQDANKLLRFRLPTAGSSAGDFADVAYWVLKSRCRNGGTLSVEEVDAHLDKIALLHASNKPRGVDEELTAMLLNMSPEEQKWLIRIILKNLHLGLSQTDILNVIHPDAKELYDVSNNLKKICEKLEDPSKRLHEIEITLFEPCRPMLSERCDILKVDSIFAKAPCYYVERKHDGERCQVHIDNGSYRYFTRAAKDSITTNSYGDSSRNGTLTPLLEKQLHSHVKTCILDGEMMGWHKKLKYFVFKGGNFDVKHLREGDPLRPCFCVFDILMLNGEVLTNQPLMKRIEVLQKIFTPLEGVFMATARKTVTSSAEIVKALNDAIDNREEGLILKKPDSIYKPAAKTGGGWYKIKPEYTVGLTDELDLIIMGGYYGEGRRKANISHFLVGVAVSPCVEGGTPTEFHSVGRVGSGYSHEELSELLEKLSPHWKPVKGLQMPEGLLWTKERPDLWIQPSKSHILQVKASEIVQTDHYKTGYTLKFPRVEKVRYDKSWSDCCTTTEFEKLRQLNFGKLASRHICSSQLGQTSPSKRMRSKAAPAVGRDQKAADLTGTTQNSSILEGRELCVLNGNNSISKQELEKRIHEHGGTIVQYRGPETYCVVAGKRDFRLKNLVDKGDVDVVNVEWLLQVLDGGRPLEWGPQDLLAMSARTREDIEMKYDSFYDSYYLPTTVESLKLSLQRVAEQGSAINLLPSEMGDLDVELFSGINEFAVFRCCVACFIASEEDGKAFTVDILRAMFESQGGRCGRIEDLNVTHVVVEVQDEKNYAMVQKINQSRSKKFHIVTQDWVESCWASRHLLAEQEFHPRSILYNV